MSSPAGTITFPCKGEDIGRGLLRQILRDLDISPAEFAKLRRTK